MSVLVWGSFTYQCGACGHSKRMYLEVGVEGPGLDYIPSPFCIACPECSQVDMTHVKWNEDERFEKPRPLAPGESYFKAGGMCGRSVHCKKEN